MILTLWDSKGSVNAVVGTWEIAVVNAVKVSDLKFVAVGTVGHDLQVMCPSCDFTVDMFVDMQAIIIPSHPATHLPWLSKASLSPLGIPTAMATTTACHHHHYHHHFDLPPSHLTLWNSDNSSRALRRDTSQAAGAFFSFFIINFWYTNAYSRLIYLW